MAGTNILHNDFTTGIVSQRLLGKVNSQAYVNGCLSIDNFLLIPQGGMTRRPGTVLLNSPAHKKQSEKNPLSGSRIIPFCISSEVNFVVELGEGTLRVWKNDCSELFRFNLSGGSYTSLTKALLGFDLYTSAEAHEVQFAQDYERLYIAHENHKPLVIAYSEKNQDGSMVPELTVSQLVPHIADGDEDNTGLFEGRDCPGIVFYHASRLWFARSKNHPYRLWASRPLSYYEYDNFEFFDNEEVVDEGVSTQKVEEAVKYGTLSATASNSALNPSVNESIWTSRVSNTGIYVFTYNGNNWIQQGEVVNLSDLGISTSATSPAVSDTITVRYYNLSEVSYKDEKIVREDNALLLEVGSARNDRICWMGAMGNSIMVGTASGEWIMPGNINGLEQNIYQASSFGSDPVQCVQAGSDLIYLQTGSRRFRSYVSSSDGYAGMDLSFVSGELGKTVHTAWQRVPEPRMYCVQEDGSMTVLAYDRQRSISGWMRWTFSGKDQDGNEVTASVRDACVIDTKDGQKVVMSIERNGRLNLEMFDEKDIMDTSMRHDCQDGDKYITVPCHFTTTSYESSYRGRGSTLGDRKRIYRAVVRVLNTKSITVGYRYVFSEGRPDTKYLETRKPDMRNMNMDDVELATPGGFEKFVAVTVLSETDNPITVSAVSLLTEV